jgi:hypothetical protein
MPPVLTVDCARNGEAPIVLEVCSPSFVRDLVTRANEELSKVRAERDGARERLSSLSSILGFGMGDDSTSLLEFVTRVERGTQHHTDIWIETQSRLTAERDAALARVRELEGVDGFEQEERHPGYCRTRILESCDSITRAARTTQNTRELESHRDSAMHRIAYEARAICHEVNTYDCRTLMDMRRSRDKYRERVRELTEWRPMSEHPAWKEGQDAVNVVVRRPRGALWVTTWWRGQYGPAVPGCIAWLPLPEPPKEGA